jgi:type 1 glutamine amidotransferase
MDYGFHVVMRTFGFLPCALAWLWFGGCSTSPPSSQEIPCSGAAVDAGEPYGPAFDADVGPGLKLLLYTYSTGYRHASIPDGINAIRALGAANGFRVDVKGSLPDGLGSYCANLPAVADTAYFTAENLSQYAAVVFLSTTTAPDSTLLDDAGKAALEAYVRAGGGFVGVHAAADAEYGWAFYHELLGATFLGHGPAVTASLRIEDAAHPAASALPDPWSRFDEWYDFTQNPRPTAHVLVNLDETTYPNNPYPMGDHPIAWCKTVGAGRSFYTGLGHAGAAFSDAMLRRHLLGGILYAAGALAADCSRPPVEGS